MSGSPSNRSVAVRSSSLATAHWALAVNIGVGVAAGLLLSAVRLHLGLPGHRALLWMTPIIVSRLLSRHPVGATAGAGGVVLTSVVLHARPAGIGASFLILTVTAGLIIDAVLDFAQRRKLSAGWLFPLLTGAGLAANILYAMKALVTSVLNHDLPFGLHGQAGYMLSHAFFGAAAGFAAAVIVSVQRRVGSRRKHEIR